MNKIREDISKWPLEKRAQKLQELFLQRMGRPLNLKNPQSFTEMTQWVKLYYHDPRISECVDKISFKDYVHRILGEDKYTATLYRVWNTPEDVSFAEIPQTCVIKSNCSSDGNNLLLIANKDRLDWGFWSKAIKSNWFDRLALHTNSFASYYYPIQPKVLVEEYLPLSMGNQNEYKILCFHGEPHLIAVPEYEWTNGKKDRYSFNSFYTLDWKCIPVNYGHKTYHEGLPRPKRLPEMLEIAVLLSADFPFVRVDFIETEGRLYLTELAFTQGGGWESYEPESFDFELGKIMNIPNTANTNYIDKDVP